MAEPFLVVAALWTDGDQSEAVSKTLRDFQTPDGFSRGAAVSFRQDVADDPEFRLVMRKMQLAEINDRPHKRKEHGHRG